LSCTEIRPGNCDGSADGTGGGAQAGNAWRGNAAGGFEDGEERSPIAGGVHAGGGRSGSGSGLDLIFDDQFGVRFNRDEISDGVAGARRERGRIGNGHFTQQQLAASRGSGTPAVWRCACGRGGSCDIEGIRGCDARIFEDIKAQRAGNGHRYRNRVGASVDVFRVIDGGSYSAPAGAELHRLLVSVAKGVFNGKDLRVG